jgi:hypothetical protein
MTRPILPKFGPWHAAPWMTAAGKTIGYQCLRVATNGVSQVATTWMASAGRNTLDECREWAEADARERNGELVP